MPLREKLKNKKTVLISKEDIDAIFSNAEEILEVHKALLQDLIRVLEKWPRCHGTEHERTFWHTHEFNIGIGKAFKRRAQDFKAYSDYVNNFKHAQNTLMNCTETNTKFRAFLDEVCNLSHVISSNSITTYHRHMPEQNSMRLPCTSSSAFR